MLKKHRSFELPSLPFDNSTKEEAFSLINKVVTEELRVRSTDDMDRLELGTLDLEAVEASFEEILRRDSIAEDVKATLESVLDYLHSIGSYGVKNGKRVYAGFDEERKVKDRALKAQRRGPYFYAQEFDDVINVVPDEYVDTIVEGDSEDVLKNLPDNCVDIVVTSPPYNFGLDYQASDDARDWESYLEKLYRVFNQCVRILKHGGRLIVNIQPLFSDYIPLHHLVSKHLMDQGLIWKGEILWEKNNYNCKYTAWGSWSSPSSPYLKYTWEFIEVFCKGTLKKAGDKENIDIEDDEFKDWVTARWSMAPERNMDEFGHPAMFPEELPRRCLKLFSYQGDFVVDPFNGVGTTTTVADRLGRRYLGVDLSEEYCRKARERLSRQLSLEEGATDFRNSS